MNLLSTALQIASIVVSILLIILILLQVKGGALGSLLGGDVGGFGVGSEFSWQGVGAYRFAFAQSRGITWSGMLGYRALYADYSKGSGDTLYQYDMLQHGPIAGISAQMICICTSRSGTK